MNENDEPTPNPVPVPKLVAVLAGALALGILGGFLVAGPLADRAAERDEDAADRVSEQEDDLRDRRDLLDARVEHIEQQTKQLGKVATKGALRATAKSTQAVKPGTEFSVDGATYTVRAVHVVDSFESKDPRRPADEVDGHRWLLVDTDFTNRAKDYAAPACGTQETVRAVLTDGSTILEYDHEPPVHPDTYDICGNNLARGASGRWVVPILVPEDATVEGLLVADVYGRTSDSPYNVVSGKAAWIRFDEPLDVGSIGDDATDITYVDEEEDA
jgi:hypothetical protein